MINFDSNKVIDSYRKKINSYELKYNSGYYTHIHTGLFNAHTFPFLNRVEVADLKKLGGDRLRFYLQMGQELLLSTLTRKNIANSKTPRILDCGAGHGGTSLYIADNYSVPVVSLTISEEQSEIIQKRVVESKNEGLISVECCNVFEYTTSEIYSHILGIDAFCQMGNHFSLFKKFNSFLSQGGYVLISDYFVKNENSFIADYFDSYWSSNITSLNNTLNAAFDCGYSIISSNDLTVQQLPFWKLSIAHSEFQISITENESEIARLNDSIKFHKAMKSAFEKDDLKYYQIILKRQTN